MRTSQGK